MSTKKLQILGSMIPQNIDADTLDGKHADEFASASDMTTLNTKVGDESVSEQISTAISNHTQDANTIIGGTFADMVIANPPSQEPSISLLRNSKLVSADTNPSNNGEICWVYE